MPDEHVVADAKARMSGTRSFSLTMLDALTRRALSNLTSHQKKKNEVPTEPTVEDGDMPT